MLSRLHATFPLLGGSSSVTADASERHHSAVSLWANSIVLVRKKDGSLPFWIDCRTHNAATMSDRFPLPRIDDLLDQLGKSKFFSTLDLAAVYWQIKVDEPSREKTAFITHHGLYKFRVMPFGLCNATPPASDGTYSSIPRLLQALCTGH